MSEIEGRNEEKIEEKARQEKLFHEYDQALQIAQHSDTIIYEVTAIVWGASTLLLGFILEVPCESSNQNLVMLSAVVGFCLSAYVPVVYWCGFRKFWHVNSGNSGTVCIRRQDL